MRKLHVVRLTKLERVELQSIVKKLKGTGPKVRRARILLKADAEGPSWTDERIAEAYSCRTRTVERRRQRFVEQGFDETLHRVERKQPLVEKLLTGDQEARIIVRRLGPPPEGYNHWTLRLSARKVVELEIVEAVSCETIRRTLKKRPDESENRILGHSTGSRRRVRRRDGRSAGNLRKTAQFRPSCPLDGRTAGAVAERNTLAYARRGQTRQAGGLRIRTGGDGHHLHVCGTVGRSA